MSDKEFPEDDATIGDETEGDSDEYELTPEETSAEMEDLVEDIVRDQKRSIFWKLYHGETSFRFIDLQKRWFIFSGVIILAGVIGLATSGLNMGIDFVGGSSWRVPAANLSEKQIDNAITPIANQAIKVQFATSKSATTGKQVRTAIVQMKTVKDQTQKITDSLAKLAGVDASQIDQNTVTSTWGREITSKALTGLVVFFIVITIYISWRFEPKMAAATFVALLHDILITIGVYALLRFQVTPPTVIAILTIQGYSIYDTIVVFDKIDENSRGLASSGRMTYSDMTNLSLNQVLMRSINTSLTALMPIVSMLIIGSLVLGVTTLEEFALALFIGLLAGAYSSIFIASPVLAYLKEKEPRYANIRQRMAGKHTLLTPAAAAMAGSRAGTQTLKASGGGQSAKAAKQTGRSAPARPKPKPRKKGKRR